MSLTTSGHARQSRIKSSERLENCRDFDERTRTSLPSWPTASPDMRIRPFSTTRGFPSKTRCNWIPPIGDFILTTSNACARSAKRAPGFPCVILVSLTTSQVCRAALGWDRRFRLYPWPHTKRSGEVRGTQEVTHGVSLQTALNLDPFMIHETFLCLTETAFGSHPCRVVSVTYRKLRPFHGHKASVLGSTCSCQSVQQP